jgi:hypothetical protein
MTADTEAGAQATGPPGKTDPAAGPSFGWLDWCGLVAAGLLVLILIDIWTDGRFITAHLPGGGPVQEGGPDA